jgi:hypothetical protein
MTEAEWHGCEELLEMLYFLVYGYRKASERKLRLFSCACCRSAWPHFKEEKARKAIELAESLADGLVNEQDRDAATLAIDFDWDGDLESPMVDEVFVARLCLDENITNRCALAAKTAAESAGKEKAEEERRQCRLLRDMFGPLPFRAVALDPAWHAWKEATVLQIARAIYDERRFADMAVLGDALEEAGCADEDILSHCREPEPHFRGCWMVDLLLGKQ